MSPARKGTPETSRCVCGMDGRRWGRAVGIQKEHTEGIPVCELSTGRGSHTEFLRGWRLVEAGHTGFLGVGWLSESRYVSRDVRSAALLRPWQWLAVAWDAERTAGDAESTAGDGEHRNGDTEHGIGDTKHIQRKRAAITTWRHHQKHVKASPETYVEAHSLCHHESGDGLKLKRSPPPVARFDDNKPIGIDYWKWTRKQLLLSNSSTCYLSLGWHQLSIVASGSDSWSNRQQDIPDRLLTDLATYCLR